MSSAKARAESQTGRPFCKDRPVYFQLVRLTGIDPTTPWFAARGRVNAGGRWTLYPAEIAALNEALWHYGTQLSLCSAGGVPARDRAGAQPREGH